MRNKIVIAAVAVVAVIAAYLLASRNRHAPVVAQGTVTFRGQPKAGVRVTYHPQFDIGAGKFNPNGTTDAQGKFTLSCGKVGDGAPPGEYVVTFEYPGVRPGGADEEIDLWKGKYNTPAASKWKVTVKKDSDETFQLD